MWVRIAWLGLGVTAGLCWGYTVDDAYIVARYARHLAAGVGYTMNPGQAATDGVTAPLWLLPGISAAWCGADPVLAQKLAGLGCMLLACGWTVAAAGARAGGRLAAPVTALLLATQPTLATWAVAGLETGAATLALVGVWRGSVARVPSVPLAGAGACCVAWLRPELLPCAGALLLGATLRTMAQPGVARRARALLGLAGLGGFLTIAFRLGLFGHPLPLSLAAKPAQLDVGADYTLRALVVTTGGLGAWPAIAAALRGRASDRTLGVSLLAHAGALVLAGGDWMPGFRLLAPVLPLYAYLTGAGVAQAVRGGVPGRTWLAAASLVVAFGVPIVDLTLRVPQARAVARSRQGAGAALAARLETVAGPVGLVDVGYLPYRSGARVFDLGGVTEPAVAHAPGTHLDKRLAEDALRRAGVRALLLHSERPPVVDSAGRLRRLSGYPVEQRVVRMRWVGQHFRVRGVFEYAPNYHYVLLVRVPE